MKKRPVDSTGTQVRTEQGHRGFPIPLVPVIAALLAAAFLLLPLTPMLCVAELRTDKLLLCLPVEKGERFLIRFTHSLNLSDWQDTIEWDGKHLICRETRFYTYGAGIPDLSDGIGKELLVTEDGFLLTGIDKVQEEIPIMLQDVPHHRLIHRDTSYDLLTRFGSGTAIVLRVGRISVVNRLLYKSTWR